MGRGSAAGPTDGRTPGYGGAGSGPGHAASALLDEALALLRGTAPHEWRSPAATAFGDAVGHLVGQVQVARSAAVVAADAARRHHAALAQVGTALGAGARP